jgi:flavorubredoxin
VIEVAPGVHAIVNWVELDGRVSWVPAGRRGWEPASIYLVDCGQEALLYDTGLPVYRRAVLEELRGTLEDRRLGIWLSRMVEPDSTGNTLALLDALPVHRVLNATHTDQLRMLTHRWREFEAAGTSVERLPWGCRFIFGQCEFEPVQPAARVIATSWLYQPGAKVLFTSDFFTHLVCSSPEESPVVTASEPVPTTAEVAEHLRAKYEWLEDADTEPIRRRLEAIFAEREVEVIAPGHGCVIRSEGAVQRHLELTLEALRDLGGPAVR